MKISSGAGTRKALCIGFLHVAVGTLAMAQTTVPAGEVSGSWTKLGSPYRIEGDIVIPHDSTLSIEPGVTVEFQGHYELLVNGRLLALGTPADTILFTINDTTGWSRTDTTLGGWDHIRLFEPLATNDSTIFAYCRIQYGKAVGPNWPWNHGGAISVVGFNKVRISNCLITNNMSGGGLGPSGGGVGVTTCDIALIGNTISNNRSIDGGGIHLAHSNSILQHNTIIGNSAVNSGGGITILGDISRTAVVSFLGDSILNNRCTGTGGGIMVYDVDSLRLDAIVIEGNAANWGGGLGVSQSTFSLANCTVNGNTSSGLGAGIASDFCDLWIAGTVLSQNVVDFAGGAMHLDHCNALMTDVVIAMNVAGNDTSGGAGGGINAYAVDADLLGCTIDRNLSTGIGGAIRADSCTFRVTGTGIDNNTSLYSGGGLQLFGCSLSMENSSVSSNSVGNDTIMGFGGGLRTVGGIVDVRDCHIDSNRTTGGGGGIGSDDDDILLERTTLGGNRAVWHGGGVHATNGTLTLRNSSSLGNVAGSDTIGGVGGGIDAARGEVILQQCTFIGDTASTGGGININNSDLSTQEVVLEGNYARQNGGALHYNVDSTYLGRPYVLRIERTEFNSNTALVQTGGARILQSAEDSNQVAVTIDRCTFRENESDAATALRLIGSFRDLSVANTSFLGNRSVRQAAAAGIVNGWGTVSNCLFAGNKAGFGTTLASGAGLSVTQLSRVDIVNCTFAANVSSSATMLSMRAGAQAWLTNCIVWGNTGKPISLVTASSPDGCQLWVNHSLVEGGVDSINIPDSLSVVHWGVGNMEEDPLFEDPGSGDYHLSSASPCIGAGIDSIQIDGFWHYAPSMDMEGNARPAPEGTRPDMGALEEGITIVGIPEEGRGDIPERFALYQNYPNPFNPSTTIKYELPNSSVVRLRVFDMLGREVAVLVNETRDAAVHKVTFDGSNLASGVYLYRLTAGSFVETRKLILVR